MTIKAIDTTYKGYRFRSRTEAKWAIFLDHAGVPWEYEPQGYVLDCEPYLPDFLLYPGTELQSWLEIKAKFPDKDEIRKTRALARETGIPAHLYFGPVEMPGPGLTEKIGRDWDEYFRGWAPEAFWSDEHGWSLRDSQAPAWQMKLKPTAYRFDYADELVAQKAGIAREPKSNFWWWTDCPHCGRVILKLTGGIGWCPLLPDPGDGALPPEMTNTPLFAHETDRLECAYRAARSARFEHGETPEPPQEPTRGSDDLRERLARILEERLAAAERGDPA